MQKLHAIILDQFKAGPGHTKVHSREYELFSSQDMAKTLSWDDSFGLISGTDISMAFVTGIYTNRPLKRCPRPGCLKQDIQAHRSGGKARYDETCSQMFPPSLLIH